MVVVHLLYLLLASVFIADLPFVYFHFDRKWPLWKEATIKLWQLKLTNQTNRFTLLLLTAAVLHSSIRWAYTFYRLWVFYTAGSVLARNRWSNISLRGERSISVSWGLPTHRSDKRHGSQNRWQPSPKTPTTNRWEKSRKSATVCDRDNSFLIPLCFFATATFVPTQTGDRQSRKRARKRHQTSPWKASWVR